MHTVWKGSISFGLVNIPIKMFTATEEKDVRFRQLHNLCNTPIRYAKECPHCEREVTAEEIVKGYEYEKGNFVIITDEEIASMSPETRKTIEILDFVELTEIDPIYFHKSYYLSPQDTADKAYVLLRDAMQQTGKIAIARFTLRNRSSLAAIRIVGPCMVLETIYYPDEVRPIEQVPELPGKHVQSGEKELAMARELINSLSASFDPDKYVDTYRANLHELIQKKVAGQEITVAPSTVKANVVDLMQALKESLAAAGQAGPSAQPLTLDSEPAPKPEKQPQKKTVALEQAAGGTTIRSIRRKGKA